MWWAASSARSGAALDFSGLTSAKEWLLVSVCGWERACDLVASIATNNCSFIV